MDLLSCSAANRFGLGARPGELAAIKDDPRGWLAAQLAGNAPLLEGDDLPASRQVLVEAANLRRAKHAEDQPAPEPGVSQPAVPGALKLAKYFRSVYLAESRTRLRAAVQTDRPFVERLVHFWANHFAVSADKPAVTGIAGAFEREAIRPHVLGRFGTMLRAVEQHPAMLLYLDNQRSIGPDSRAVRFIARRQRGAVGPGGRHPGINENLAREMLELHTLGVDGGYTQVDVTAFAGILIGWSVGRDGLFEFRDAWHEPRASTLLGKRFAQAGLAQGEAVLEDLARHPATARHIARKLAVHFVVDDPPSALVDRLARTFLDGGGDLLAVYRALLESDLAWRPAAGKFKTPADYIVSAHRALSLPVEDGPRSLAAFTLLGQRPWMPGSPAGWPDRTADWAGSAAVFKRVQWANAVAARLRSRRRADALAPEVLGARLSAHSRRAISGADSAAQALTLLLACPEFMWRPA